MELFAKSHVFLRKTIKNTNLIVPRFAYKANRNSKSGTETTPRLVSMLESNDDIRFSKRASVENHISRVKPDSLNLREIAIT